jgi:hypothetical protein
MKMIKKFEDFDLGRFSNTDADEQEWLDHVKGEQEQEIDNEIEISDLEEDDFYTRDDDFSDNEEEEEDCEECETEVPIRKTWGDEVIESRIIKSFDNFSSINEEEVIGKAVEFFTGKKPGKDEDFDKRKESFEKEIEELEAKVDKNPDKYEFNKDKIKAIAKSNNYLGEIVTQKAKTRNSIIVYYKDGKTGAEKIATATSQEKNMFGK